jgi:hypothetical protein
MNSDEELSKKNDTNNYFKLPIFYNKDKVELNKSIINDLELTTTIDQSCNPIYTFYFDNENDISKQIISQTAKYYTTDVHFLKENQQLLKEYKRLDNKYTKYSPNYKNILDIWKELKIENGFKEKYCYVEWEKVEFLNSSILFLQFISLYNLFSPIFSLLMPIVIMIIPFLIIKLKGMDLTISQYILILKIVAQQNAIGKLFTTNFFDIQFQERIYIIVSAALYLYSIYQNIMVCVRFHTNMINIHNYFKEIRVYVDYTLSSMRNYMNYSGELLTHSDFNNNLVIKMDLLKNIKEKLDKITDYNLFNITKLSQIGNVLKYFYELHNDKEYEEAIMYSFGFNGYIDCIEGLQNNLIERKINLAVFIEENKKNVISDSYYACLKNNNPVKNTIKLKKNIIITGPNASGKTTVLKSTLINIILTQQFGCGFYSSAKLKPYKHIHCYLNIPDTSGRDSLFQAEARRCKEIIDNINTYDDDTHFCVFDELYSGTNPEEAELSAVAFMKYLTKRKKVSCLLTTHFIKVCKNLKKNPNIINKHMVTDKKDGRIKYMYTLKDGISDVKGGIDILTEMNYPKEIIHSTKKHNKK